MTFFPQMTTFQHSHVAYPTCVKSAKLLKLDAFISGKFYVFLPFDFIQVTYTHRKFGF